MLSVRVNLLMFLWGCGRCARIVHKSTGIWIVRVDLSDAFGAKINSMATCRFIGA
jgi:hypothetical protein